VRETAELVQIDQEVVAGVSRVLKGITTANAQLGELIRNRWIDTAPDTEKELRDSSTVGDSVLPQTRTVAAPVAG
jgi:hypothetical protein